MPATTNQAIVFDLDDTLYPERAYVISGFRAVAQAMKDVLGTPESTLQRMIGLFDSPDRLVVYDQLVTELGIPDRDSIVAEMVRVYREHSPIIDTYEDVENALRRLGKMYKLGLITDGRANAQHAKIDALGLRPRFDHIIVTDDLGREFWKPHPRAFEEMVVALDVAPHACTYVGDNPSKDFITPNRLGWRTIQIARPDAIHGNVSPAPGGQARRQITSLAEID